MIEQRWRLATIEDHVNTPVFKDQCGRGLVLQYRQIQTGLFARQDGSIDHGPHWSAWVDVPVATNEEG